MTDTTPGGRAPRRPVVPTARELAAGTWVDEGLPVVVSIEEPPRPHVTWAGVRSQIAAFDPRSIEGPTLPLVVFSAVGFVAAWDAAALSVLLPDIQSSYHLKLQILINLTTIFTAVALVFGPVAGYLVDRVKRVWMVVPSLVVGAIARLVTGLPGGIVQLGFARGAASLSGAVSGPATYPLLADYYPPRSRARTFGLLFLSGALGTVVGSPISGGMADVFGWRSVFILTGVLSLIVSVAALRLREPIRGALDRLEAGLGDITVVQKAPSWAESWRAARSITTLRRLWYAIMFLVAGSAEVTAVILPVFYKQVLHLGAAQRGYIGAGTGIAGLIGLAVSGPVADRLLRDRPARVLTLFGGVLLFQAASFVLISASPSVWIAAPLAMPIAFGAALLTPGFVLLISLIVPARFRGLGIQTLSWWTLAGLGLFVIVYNGIAANASIRELFLIFAPVVAIGGLILTTASSGFDRDMRAALAGSAADLEARRAREAGRAKMLICRDLDVDYAGVQVLFGVDFDVDEGEIVALLGTNGAGKSTLLRAISGINEPATGAVFLDGEDVTHVPANEKAARGVVMLPGGHAIFPTLTVDENLRTALWLRRDESAQSATQAMDEVLALFPSLAERRTALAGNLSGGEQQMLAVSQAMLMRPRLLLIDELSLGLAPAIVQQLLDTLRTIAARGTTMVLVEQSVNVALTIAERAVFMEKGEVRFDGPTVELLRRPDLMRAVFMGNTAGAKGDLTANSRRSDTEPGSRLLSVRDVSVQFGGVQALSHVDLEADAGEIVGILGPNGAGKTTLMDVICGLTPTTSGTVSIADQDVTGLQPYLRARLGLARSFQDVRLFPALTVHETLAVAFERHLGLRSAVLAAAWAPNVRRVERRITRRVDRLISLLALEAFADKFINELSTGSRRLVDIGCVMAAEPKVLLLDEPASGLAQAETEELAPVLHRLVRETGCAAVVIEHDLPLLTAIADRLVAMHLGEVLTSGSVAEVVAHPDVIRSYLSASDEVIVRSGATAESALHTMERLI